MNYSILDGHKIIPVVVLDELDDAIPTLQALKKGGINIAEITFRTECAENAITLAANLLEFSDMTIGAGTVINKGQCKAALKAGAKFIVSPGFSLEVLKTCRDAGIPYIPGAITPTEIMTCLEENLSLLKFFPAKCFGGVKTLKSLSAVFPHIRFLPTGGIDNTNMNEYLSLSCVKAIGGSWMMKGSFQEIENLCKQANEMLK